MLAPVISPLRQYFERGGDPLDAGYLYFGEAGDDPEVDPVTVYWDAAGTIPAAQPIRTQAGYPVRSGAPAVVYVDGSYSFKIKDKRGALVYYLATVTDDLGSLAVDLGSSISATKGAALLGYSPTLDYVAGTIGRALRGWVCPQDAPWNADYTGATDATTALQACIDYAKANTFGVDLRTGVYLTGPLKLNGTGYTGPADEQWTGVVALKGGGRPFAQCVLRGKAGAFAPGQYLLTGRNLSGVYIGGFSIDGDGTADCGLDLEWIGGSNGDSTIAPSCHNIIENIFVDGCVVTGINVNQMNDCPIRGLWVRGVGATHYGLLANGGGGQMSLSDCWVSAGKAQVSCQNGGLINCGWFGGLELAGASYNNITAVSNHFYPNASTGNCIDSIGIGNASRGLVLLSCYFNDASAPAIGGRFWQGGRAIGCHFFGPVFDTITPAAGTGQLPVWSFEGASFEGATPDSTAAQYRVRLSGCRSSSGQILSSDDTMSYVPLWLSTGTAPVIGNGSIAGKYVKFGQLVTAQIKITIGSTTTLGTGVYGFTLPFSVEPTTGILGDCLTTDVSASLVYPGSVIGASTISVGCINASGAQMTPSVPVALAVGDTIALSISYISDAI